MIRRFFSWLRLLFGLGLLAALVIYVDAREVGDAIANLDAERASLAAVFLVFATFLGALNLNLMISTKGEVALQRFLPIYWTSWAFSLVVPGQFGDMISLPVLLKKHGFNWSSSLGRALVDKFMSLAVMLTLGGLGLAAFVETLSSDTHIMQWAWFVLVPMLVVLVLYRRIPIPGDSWTSRAKTFFQNTMREFFVTIERNPARVVVNFLLTWLKVGLTGGSFWLVFGALGHTSSGYLEILPLMAASALVAYLPISFNGLGTVELAGIILFSTLGMDESMVVTAYLVLRAANILLAWLPAAIWLTLTSIQQEEHRERP